MRIINIDITKIFPENTLYCGRNYKLWKQNNQIGKPLYGNPFKRGAWTSRENVILAHFHYTTFKMLNNEYRKQIINMKNFNLACHCKPQSCHCDNYRLLECEEYNNFDKKIFINICRFIVFLMNQEINWKQTIFSQTLKNIAKILILNKTIQKKDELWIITNNKINELEIELKNNIFILCEQIYNDQKESYLFIEAFCSLSC